ncbi:XRE family transcriptional regulator [Neobacillus rhizosphaerae]|uniref:helix-turn-helix domain-containing protein n=1 Tax=Neobacillus rhizosphaerae TaxID=2880965 RepID=UPI003D28C011
MDQKTISANLRRIRESNGLNQTQAASLSNLSRIAYRNIENGDSTPKISTLQSIATGFGIQLQELFAPVKRLEKVRFRALKKMNNRDHIITEVARWLEDYKQLEEILDINESFKFEHLVKQLAKMKPGTERAIYAANQARMFLDLQETEPIRDIAGLLEDNGIKVYQISMATEGFFGLSVGKEEGGPAVVVNVWDRISVERWIFSAIHELGHLLLHFNDLDLEKIDEDPVEENEANTFASYFQMPIEAFNREWKETAGLDFVDRVLKVKRIFQVSYKTVLYRLSERFGKRVWGQFQSAYRSRSGKTLSMKEEPEALDSSSFSEVLRAQEPDSLSSSAFIEDRLSRLVHEAYKKDLISKSRAAEILRIDIDSIQKRIDQWFEFEWE